MSNLNYIEAQTLPSHELIYNSSGEIIGIRVKRSSYTLYYHRTDRGACVLKDTGLLFEKSFTRQSRFLDLGCGDGALVLELAKMGYRSVSGLDLYLSPQQKKNPYFYQGDAFRSPFKNQSFDFIFSSWSLFSYEPLFQLGVLFNEVMRLLKPGGRFYVLPIFEKDRISLLQEIAKKQRVRVGTHPQSGLLAFMPSFK